jgi:hypothetical protein
MTRLESLSLISLPLAVLLGLVPACAQDKPDLVVHPFTVASGVNFPYDMKDLQAQAIVELTH